MIRVYVSVGSNVDRETNVRAAVAALRAEFGRLVVSTVYSSRAIGFSGEDFYNLTVGFRTDRPVHAVLERLRGIEAERGRKRSDLRFGPRTLDIDLLLYGDLVLSDDKVRVPREEITRFAFVLGPLAEIAGEVPHPETGERISDLWSRFEADDQVLTPVPFVWQESAATS